MHQRRLIPLLAKTAIWNFTGNRILILWGKNQKHLFTPNNRKLAELHALISGLKAVMSLEGSDGLAECRRACGGLGYSHYAGIGRY